MEPNLEQNMNETVKPLSTRTVGMRYGLFLGILSIAYFVIMVVAGLDMTQGIWKWASYVFVIGILFMANKYFKDNGNGFMSYGQGVGISFWVGTVASVLSSVFTFIYLKFIDGSLLVTISDQARQKMEDEGKMSSEQIDQAMSITANFMTPTAFLIFGIVFGIIGTVICGLIMSAFTQKANPDPSY